MVNAYNLSKRAIAKMQAVIIAIIVVVAVIAALLITYLVFRGLRRPLEKYQMEYVWAPYCH